jgi:hypothetical protein
VNVGRAHLRGQQQSAKSHDGGLRGAPGAGGLLLLRNKAEGFAPRLGGVAPLDPSYLSWPRPVGCQQACWHAPFGKATGKSACRFDIPTHLWVSLAGSLD